MANKYLFDRDSIRVNGRTFPARYEVMTEDGLTVRIWATVEGGPDGGSAAEVLIEVPATDKQHAAALQAAQIGLTLDAATPEDGGRAADPEPAAGAEGVQTTPEDGGSVPEAVVYAVETIDAGNLAAADGGTEPAAGAEGVQATPEDGDGDGDGATVADIVKAAPNVHLIRVGYPVAETAAAEPEPAALEAVAVCDNTVNETAAAEPAAETTTAETITATAEKEEETMKKQENRAAEVERVEAVKAAAAAEVEEMTTAADAAPDPKKAHGPIPEKTFKNEVIAGNGWSIVFDAGCNRTRVIIAEPVKAAAKPIVEEAGFYYSRTLDSWNKKLTHRAHRAALALAEKLRATFA